MKWGVTDPIVLTLPSGFIEHAEKLVVTVYQDERPPLIFRSADGDMEVDMDDGTITIPISQEQTFRFHPGYAYAELRWLNDDGTTGGTDAARIKVRGSINREKMA